MTVPSRTPCLADAPARPLPRGLTHRWSYEPSVPTIAARLERLRARLKRGAFPSHAIVEPPRRALDPCVLYFVYAPQGTLSRAHEVTLQRVRDLGLALYVVCATPTVATVPAELRRYADAIAWKDLTGYDLSGYTVGLRDIAARSPGATVFVLNDSVFGPVSDLRPLIAAAPWDLTGLTAQDCDENHVQSYAFILRGATPQRMDDLSDVLTTQWACNWTDHVVAAQEVPLARLAARTMSVGAYVHARIAEAGDPMLGCAFDLLDLGHPFLKKSLLGKMSACQDTERVMQYVVDHRLIDPRA